MSPKLKQKIESPGFSIEQNKSLKEFTTIKAGGSADYFVRAENSEKLKELLAFCKENNIKHFVLGKGSNILFTDKGFRGMVILNESDNWEVLGPVEIGLKQSSAHARFDADYSAKLNSSLQNKTTDDKNVIVRCDSGVKLPRLIKDLHKQDISGLEWFTGIPATIGGSVYMNLHGGNLFIGDLVFRACLFDGKELKIVGNDYFQFDYDFSILHKTRETIIWVELILNKGGVEEAKELSKAWAIEKKRQPQKSAGCIFKNLTKEMAEQKGLKSQSVGYLTDKILGLKGLRQGDAIISEYHAAFIENLGNANSTDIIYLIEKIKNEAKKKLDLELELEIEIIGDL